MLLWADVRAYTTSSSHELIPLQSTLMRTCSKKQCFIVTTCDSQARKLKDKKEAHTYDHLLSSRLQLRSMQCMHANANASTKNPFCAVQTESAKRTGIVLAVTYSAPPFPEYLNAARPALQKSRAGVVIDYTLVRSSRLIHILLPILCPFKACRRWLPTDPIDRSRRELALGLRRQRRWMNHRRPRWCLV